MNRTNWDKYRRITSTIMTHTHLLLANDEMLTRSFRRPLIGLQLAASGGQGVQVSLSLATSPHCCLVQLRVSPGLLAKAGHLRGQALHVLSR